MTDHALDCVCVDCLRYWEYDHYLDCSKGMPSCARCAAYLKSQEDKLIERVGESW